MTRKDFIRTMGCACIGIAAAPVLLQSCVSSRDISVGITGDSLQVPLAKFMKNDAYLAYLIVRNENLQFPIYVFRFSENEYSALYLQCTHQGNELNAYGEKLVCSAHGSEFDNRGGVTNGPATDALRSFPVQIDNSHITISLKQA